MPLIVLAQISRDYIVPMKGLCSLYPIYVEEISEYENKVRRNHFRNNHKIEFNVYAESILLGIFDSKKRKLYEPLEYWLVPLSTSIYYDRCTMKISDLVKKHSLPVKYYIVLAIYGIRVSGTIKNNSDEYIERINILYPILPDSVEKVGFTKDTLNIWEDVKQKIDLVMRITKEYSYWSMLIGTPLSGIVDDLMEASSRYNMGDYEGAIKFYRKVIEGIRNFLQTASKIDGSEKRAEVLLNFSKKAFHLISNFGEHFGTQGGLEEAELAKDIALDLLKYVITKIKHKRIEYRMKEFHK